MNVKPIPDGMHAVTPHLVCAGAAEAMLVDEMPQWGALGPKSLKGSPVTLHLYVEDVDAAVKRAVAAGAKVTMPVEDMFWGGPPGLECGACRRSSPSPGSRKPTPAASRR